MLYGTWKDMPYTRKYENESHNQEQMIQQMVNMRQKGCRNTSPFLFTCKGYCSQDIGIESSTKHLFTSHKYTIFLHRVVENI